MTDVAQLALRQLADYDAHRPGMVFSDEVDLTENEAYEVQTRVAALREERGEACIGYKVGCTSETIQRQLGIDRPVFGHLFASERLESGARLSLSRFDHLAVEGELAVILERDLTGLASSKAEVREAVRCAFPVIELHHHVFRRPRSSVEELVANNCLHAGFVAPGRLPEDAAVGPDRLTIHVDGKLVEAVPAAELEEGVKRSLSWLAGALDARGERLRAGQVVLTGTRARLVSPGSPGHIVVETAPRGVVEAWVES